MFFRVYEVRRIQDCSLITRMYLRQEGNINMKIKILLQVVILLFVHTLASYGQDFNIAIESSMRKVFIKNDVSKFKGVFTTRAAVKLAKNEYESFQVVVIPSKDLRNVRVVPESFGGGLTVEAHPVGYVYVSQPSGNFGSEYVGWYPDPILIFVDGVDIKAGDYQAFWITVFAPKGTPAGEYTGKLRVVADNAPSQKVDVRVTVWDFELPDKPSFPTAMSWKGGKDFERIYQNTSHFQKLKDEGDRYILWDDFKYLVQKYRLFPDRIYGHGLRYLRDFYNRYGWIDPSNLVPGPIHIAERNGNFYANASNIQLDEYVTSYIDRLKREYAQLPAGMRRSVYTYLLDEEPESRYDVAIERVLKRLRNEMPEITIVIDSFQDKIVWQFDDNFVQYFDVLVFWEFWPSDKTGGGIAQFLKARDYLHSKGKQIWWYVTDSTPSAVNWHLESELINTRLLLGAINYKFKPDGFLYWEIGDWTSSGANENNHPLSISHGSYCNWDPRTVGLRQNGDAQLIYPGPSSIVPSIRLANFRDGMEDYEYLKILGKARNFSSDQNLIAQADSILNVPSEIVGSYPLDHTYSPEALDSFRAKTAELIVKLGGAKIIQQDTTPPRPPSGLKIK